MRVKNKPIKDGTRFNVAVFYAEGWERYGRPMSFATEAEARVWRDALLQIGHKHVHIWSVTTNLIQE